MNYGPRFETSNTKKWENDFYDRLSKRTGLEIKRAKEFAHCDADLHNWRGVCATTEYRRRFCDIWRYWTFWISAKKVLHGLERGCRLGVPFIYCVQWVEGDFYYHFKPGAALQLNWSWGGHSLGKMRYEYDREWGINISPADFKGFTFEQDLFFWTCLHAGAVTDGYTEKELQEVKRKAFQKQPSV